MHLTELEQVRKNRLDKIRELGFDPYGRSSNNDFTSIKIDPISAATQIFIANEPTAAPVFLIKQWRVQGRIVLLRDNGGLIWLKLKDDSGEVQIAISKKDIANENLFKLAKLLDLGDILLVDGPFKRTKTGELTIWATSITLACKSLAHPPDKVAGLQDIEIRYRKRYLDMAFNGEFTKTLRARSRIISLLREEFQDRKFIEVETPMLHPIAGGAAARPFETHLNALDMSIFLRVAPELYLKRLIVGGMSKVFEINRNFRNEGIDSTHNPEFTALEAYAINEDCISLMNLVESSIRSIVSNLRRTINENRNYVFEYNGHSIDFEKPFHVTTYYDLYLKGTGKSLLAETDFVTVNKVFEEKCETLIDPSVPTFVTGYPLAISPLTKPDVLLPSIIAQRADLFIGGMEIGTIYTEQNDPQAQYDAFVKQLQGENDEDRTHRTLDDDFIEALKVGMPPTGGLGLGVDRLVMLLTGQTSVRDVLAFPFMRSVAMATI